MTTFPLSHRPARLLQSVTVILGATLMTGLAQAVTIGGAAMSPRESFRNALTMALPVPPGSEPRYEAVPFTMPPLPTAEETQAEVEARAAALKADLKTIVPVEDLPAVGSAAFLTLRAEALGIVERYFREARAALEPDAVGQYATQVTWTPDFSAVPRTISAADRDRARQSSYAVAYAITHLDRPRFVVAYAAAVFALHPDGALEAENAASAIATAAERLYPTANDVSRLTSARNDAAVVYRYALACSVEGGKWTRRSLGVLVNLGNLYVDLQAPERARPVLLAARVFAPFSWDAALALASCYLLQGRPELARAALEGQPVRPSALFATARKGSATLEHLRTGGDLTPESSDEEIDTALKTFEGRETLTAADFVGQIDQSERLRMRRFVDELPVQGSFRAPPIAELTQFSTLESISTPAGFRALGDFGERLGGYSLKLMAYMMQGQYEALGRLGLNLKLNVDIADVMAHPERYKDRDIQASVTGVEQLRARLPEMRRQAEQAKANLAAGNMAALMKQFMPAAVAVNPVLGIYALKPFDYANPMDVMIQQYNASVLARKLHVYNTSFFAVNGRTRDALAEVAERHAKKFASIHEMEALEMAAFDRKRAAAAKSGVDVNSAQWRLMEHNIHRRFRADYNAQGEYAWKEATQVAAKAYSDKIRPRAERFYYDVFRHIALISDPEVREKKNREFEQMLLFGLYHGLVNVLSAFGSVGYVQEWDCHCDVGALLAEAEKEEKELDRIRDERAARDIAARLQFESGEIPPASPLFKKIDAYGTEIEIPFIPMVKGWISPARSSLSLAASLPTKIGGKGSYTFTESAFTGATTHSGSVEIGATLDEGSVKTSATISVRGSISIDGKGQVSDYSVTGRSEVVMGIGPVTGKIGGEIGYTPAGGLTSDMSGGITAALKGDYGRSMEVSIEGSAVRGCTFSAKAEQNLNPESGEVDKFLKDVTDEHLGKAYPFYTGLKKQLWSGKFTL